MIFFDCLFKNFFNLLGIIFITKITWIIKIAYFH